MDSLDWDAVLILFTVAFCVMAFALEYASEPFVYF